MHGPRPHGLPFDWNAMLVDFMVESFTEHNLILDIVSGGGILFLARVGPELNSIKEMKPGEVDYGRRLRLLIRAEKDGGGEDTLESGNHAAIMGTVLGQVKEVEDPRGRPKPNDAGLLFHRKGSDPNGNEAVLPEGEAGGWRIRPNGFCRDAKTAHRQRGFPLKGSETQGPS